MYVPGIKELVAFFMAVLLVMVALVTQSPVAPVLALSALLAYYAYARRIAIKAKLDVGKGRKCIA